MILWLKMWSAQELLHVGKHKWREIFPDRFFLFRLEWNVKRFSRFTKNNRFLRSISLHLVCFLLVVAVDVELLLNAIQWASEKLKWSVLSISNFWIFLNSQDINLKTKLSTNFTEIGHFSDNFVVNLSSENPFLELGSGFGSANC